MIQHIKIISLSRILILIGVVLIFFSCEKSVNTNEQLYVDSEKITTNNLSYTTKSDLHDFTGYWEVSKRLKIGEWKLNEDYYYTKEEFEKQYDNLLIEIGTQYLTVRSPSNCFGNLDIVLESKFSISGTDQDKLNEFLLSNLKIDPNSYIGYINTDCEYPHNKIYLFKNNLVFQEYGAFFYVLEKVINESSNIGLQKECTQENDMENFSFIEKCEYIENTDFGSLYKDMIKNYNMDFALEQLPKTDTSFSTPNSLELKYTIQKDTVSISHFFEAGENHYLIYRKGKNGIVEQIATPD